MELRRSSSLWVQYICQLWLPGQVLVLQLWLPGQVLILPVVAPWTGTSAVLLKTPSVLSSPPHQPCSLVSFTFGLKHNITTTTTTKSQLWIKSRAFK